MLAIKNIRLIDVVNKKVEENCTLLINKDRIEAVGRNLSIPEDCSVINAHGLTAIPGLIDAHTHFGGSCEFDRPGCGKRKETYDYAEAREGFLRFGVTSVRTCGDHQKEMASFKKSQEAGEVLAPRIMTNGLFLQGEEGHPWATVYMKDELVKENALRFADKDNSIEEQVEEIKALGADFIKVFYGHINKLNYPTPVPKMSREQLSRAVAAAHAGSLKCAVHVDGPDEMMDAVHAGADFIEHMIAAGSTETIYTEEMIASIKESGAVVDPTMICILRFDNTPGFPSVWEDLKHAVNQFYLAGIPMLVGCDSGIPFVPHGESLHDEMACLCEAGIPNMEVLAMATCQNARLLGMNQVGSLEAGKKADLILLGSDPLSDIASTKDIQLVMMDGEIIFEKFLSAFR